MDPPVVSQSAPSVQQAAEMMHEKNDFGQKRIGFWFSIALLINNITGPGMVLYPALFQQAGWFIPTLTMVICTLLSAIAGLCLLYSMAIIPGNSRFELRFEFTNVARYYVGDRAYRVILFFFIVSLLSSVLPMIIQSAQVMDYLLVAIFGKSCAVQMYPSLSWVCSVGGQDVEPFGDSVVVLSMGLLVLAIVSLPVGFFNLDDNVIIQAGASISLFAIVFVWLGIFVNHGLLPDSVPVVGTNFSKVLGLVVFNYTFVSCIPSWINEKKPGVSSPRVVWLSLLLSTFIFLFIGIFGGLAFPPYYDEDADLLSKLNQSGSLLARITYFFFPLVVDLTSIPIFSIMIRYNLLSNQICSKRWANFWSVLFPWLLVVPFYTGNGLSEVVQWTGIFVNGFVNFVIPLYIYMVAIRTQQHIGRNHRATGFSVAIDDVADPVQPSQSGGSIAPHTGAIDSPSNSLLSWDDDAPLVRGTSEDADMDHVFRALGASDRQIVQLHMQQQQQQQESSSYQPPHATASAVLPSSTGVPPGPDAGGSDTASLQDKPVKEHTPDPFQLVLPTGYLHHRGTLAIATIAIFSVLIIAVIATDIYYLAIGQSIV